MIKGFQKEFQLASMRLFLFISQPWVRKSELNLLARSIFVCGLVWLVLGFGCTPIGDDQRPKGPEHSYPLAEYKDSTVLTMHEGSRLSWILRTLRLTKFNTSDRIETKPVDLKVYDSTGAEVVHVTADSGTVDESVSFLGAMGHVHGRSTKGLDITTDSLRWNKAENRISTESRVRVITEDGDVLTGRGFVSDANLDNWQILSDVKGVFQKVEERIEKNDTAQTATDSTAKKVDSSATEVQP